MTERLTATAPPALLLGEEALLGAPKGHVSASSVLSPRIAIHEDAAAGERRPSVVSHISAPAVQQYHSPMRQHKRTPSQHREIKETLNARSEYTNDDTEGTKLRINQYVIKEEIGRGSYGAVHLATDQYGNEYAIKEFSKSRLRRRAQSNMLKRPGGLRPGRGMRSPFSPHSTEMSNQDAAEAKDSLFLIREEIAIMKKLNHPNLVSLIEVLDDPEEDSLWIVLEMCKKGVIMKIGLDDDAEPYTKEQCRYWFRDLILGIEYLHAQGIIHRDIKPDNLLLTEDDCLKIVDFGVSEMFEKSADMRTAKSAGSPAFLPPELCMAKHGDISGKAADIWSMGVSLYCLKYGKLPFHQHNVLEMYESIRTQELTLPPDEDADFVDLLKRMLTKDPEQRICMSGVRNHPWVTRDGEDPLLSESENITELVEPPNELELNHALTRKMSNMMTVMMAINKFKGLINKSRPSTPGLKTPGTPKTLQVPVDIPETSQETTPTAEKPQPENNRPRQKSVAEEAADLVEARKAFHASKEPFPGEKGPAQDATGSATAFLGIGLGGSDDFATAETPAEFVSDSPTGIDFDIYDRAFEAEMERIRSEKQHGGHRRKTYMTRFVNRKDKYFGDDCMIMEAGSGIPALASSGVDKVSSAAVKTLSHVGLTHRPGSSSVEDKDEGTWKKEHARDAVEARKIHGHDPIQGIKEKGHKFAELVMGTMSVAKSKVSGEAKESGQ